MVWCMRVDMEGKNSGKVTEDKYEGQGSPFSAIQRIQEQANGSRSGDQIK